MPKDLIYQSAIGVLCALLGILFMGEIFFVKTFFDDVRMELKQNSEIVWKLRQDVAVIQAMQDTRMERLKR